MAETRFSRWLDRERGRANLNYTGLGELVGVKPNTARAWCIGESEPTPANVQALAEVLHSDVTYLFRLLGWLPDEDTAPTEAHRRVIAKLRQLSEEKIAQVEDQVDLVLRRQ
jgi:transcriptional regulator with XRE-family HTH domain